MPSKAFNAGRRIRTKGAWGLELYALPSELLEGVYIGNDNRGLS